MLLSICLLAQAAPPPPEIAEAPVALHGALVERWRGSQVGELGGSQVGEGTADAPELPAELIPVVLELSPGLPLAEGVAMVERLVEDMGLSVQAAGGGMVQVGCPPERLLELAWLPGVARARPPHYASAKEVESEGAEALFVNHDWRAEGLTGEGVQLAAIDVGYSGFTAQLGEELPRDTTLAWGEEGRSAHGLAVAEVLHDVAPGASLRLYTMSTDVEFVEALEAAVNDGVDVISASIGFDNVWHADGTSPLARAVDAAQDAGVVYVNAAGNEVGRYRIGALSDVDGDGIAEIDGDPEVWLVWSPEVTASLRWSEPFGQAQVDLDLELYDDGALCGQGAEPQAGQGVPYEWASCQPSSGSVIAQVRVSAGEVDGLTAWIYAPWQLASGESVAEAGTLTLPADARGAIAVGAYDLETERLESYSSQGPTDDGRLKPELVAAGSVSTSAGRLSFTGSSAATPHVAGLAALIVQRRRIDRPEKLTAILMDQAKDLGPGGWDDAYGAGAARAGELPRRCGCGAHGLGGVGAWAWALAGVFALARRRRPLLAKPLAILYTSPQPRG